MLLYANRIIQSVVLIWFVSLCVGMGVLLRPISFIFKKSHTHRHLTLLEQSRDTLFRSLKPLNLILIRSLYLSQNYANP